MFSIIARNGEAAGNVGKYEPRQRICEDTIAWHSFNNAKLTANNTAAAVPMHTGNTYFTINLHTFESCGCSSK